MKLANQVFKDEKAPVAALLATFLKRYGVEAMDWEPELVRKEIEEDYRIEMSSLTADKLQAGIQILKFESFESRWKVFETCCHLICNIDDSLDSVHPLEVEEIIAGIAEASLIRDEKLDYSSEILAYVGKIFADYGFSHSPKLFPDAIMPTGLVSINNDEKNEALQEIFDAHLDYVVSYLKDI
jgi:hypothetical protein